MIKVIKENSDEWTVWNQENNETAIIKTIAEYSLLPTSKKYRVDYKGRTIASALKHFQSAKKEAYKAVKGE